MAHGTGRYYNRKYNQDIKKDEYCVIFCQCYNYFYPQMSDCYEPDCYPEDDFQVQIIKWRKDRYNHTVADHISPQICISNINKDEANKIYWNLKNKDISFDQCMKYFKDLSFRRKGYYREENL